jgi:hypothetical protein
MSGFHYIIFTLASLGKATYSPVLAQGMKGIPAAGNEFMGVALVADIPDQFIFWGVKDIVQGQGQLNHAETGRKMTACFRDRCDDVFPYLPGKNFQGRKVKFAQIIGGINGIQQV